MAQRSQQAQFSFSSGVLSPRLTLRGDSERYGAACQKAENFIISPQGGAVYREGMELIGTPAVDAAFRVMQFHRGGDESDVLFEVNTLQTRYWIDDALVESAPDVPLVTVNPYLQDELNDLYFTNQETLGITCHEAHPPLYTTVDVNGVITAQQLAFNRIPLTSYNDPKSPSSASGTTTYDITFNSMVTGEVYAISYGGEVAMTPFPDPQPIPFNVETTNDAKQINDIAAGLGLLNNLNSATIGTPTGIWPNYQVIISGVGAGQLMAFAVLQATDPNAFISIAQSGDTNSGTEPAWSYPYVVSNGGTPNYYQCIVPHKSEASNEPGVGASWQTYWTDLGTTPPAWWAYQHDSSNPWALDQFYGPWDRGFPTVCVFHEQRLILAASPDAGTRLWGSRIGSYEDFTGGSNASDPFEFALDTSDTPHIKWMQSQLNLMIGTSSGDWNLSAEQTLGPADISAVKQNNARSHHAKPAVVDTEIFYIEQGKTKLRATRYVRDYNGFSSLDVSMMSEHLLYDGINRLVVQHVPEVLMVMLTQTPDQQLRFLSYNKSGEISAWSSAETFADIFDIAGYFSITNDQDALYCAVRRNGAFYLEKMPYPARRFIPNVPLTTQGIVYMDGWVSGTVVGAVIGGDGSIDSLEGLTVGVLVDDAWQVGTYVVTNGAITLPENHDGAAYAVGLIYAGEVHTFEHITGNPRGIGFGTARRWNKLYVRVLDSALPIIRTADPDGKNPVDQLPPDRTPATPMNIAEIIRDGVNNNRVANVGFGDGSVTIRQDRPYPVNCLGLYGEFSSENA